ncbi:hypothetical protein ATK78_1125 [Pedobacter metabolipauper]|uniref:Uncharacterized protein n=2 Tax=Pedobacter metabolipauper TaxID=425513 RepID=A0A4R6T0U1_9SPHI|nr:hypothetical protein ATK78_1125 [Pedobacter metabolipauper]
METVAGKEIYHAIHKSKSKNKCKKLLLGDSVAEQLFSNETDHGNTTSLATNAAVTMAGQFFLLNNYLNAGNKIDTVYLLFRPLSFGKNLDEQFTYHYFLKPFYNQEYIPLFTKTAIQQAEKIPYAQFCSYPTFLTTNWAPDFVSKDKNKFTFLSPISVEYLQKIQQLASLKHFKFIILSTPMSHIFKRKIAAMNQQEITEYGLQNEFGDYFKSITYLNDSNFVDNIHLKDPVAYRTHYKQEIN